MKYCPNCGNANDDGNKFCGDCGKVFVQSEKLESDTTEKSTKEQKDYEKKKKFSFTKKLIVFSSIFVVLILIIFTGMYINDKNTKERELVAEAQEFLGNTRIKVLEDSMDSYENKDTGFLKEYIVEYGFYKLEDELDSYIRNSDPYMLTKDDEINKQVKDVSKRAKVLKNRYNRINEKIETQKRVNNLYLQVYDHTTGQLQYKTIAINGDKVSYNLPINENLKEYDFNQAKKDYVEEKDGKSLSQWQKAINKLIINVESQYKPVHGGAQNNNNKATNDNNNMQKSSSNTDKEKLKKQLTDKTFIAPKSNAEGRLSVAELEMALKEYLMPKNAKHEEYELEKSESKTPDNKLVYAFKKDNHKGSMVTTGYYVLDENGYVYKCNFMEEKAEDTPLTNIYIAGVLPNDDDSRKENEWQTYEEHQKEREEKIKEDKKNGTYDKNDPLKYQ
ncbi:zinc ribbon domain-containing protein [Bacillus tropicus]|uniref:zinc ribbon domain-containing protein n=1 Tax=Bacillus tropicus TaxID=2026188 RepID=UPI0013F4D0DC|nr:zinc ribbon domain-containing protein [Bacillus tropicus]